MAIISSDILRDLASKDGRRKLIIKLVDSEGDTHILFRKVLSDYDEAAGLVVIASDYEVALAESEAEEAISRVDNGEDALSVVDDFKHSSKKEIAKKLIRYMMRSRSVYVAISMEPLIEYLKSNYTNTQLSAFLDITSDQLVKLNSKYNSVIAQKTMLQAVDVQEDWS